MHRASKFLASVMAALITCAGIATTATSAQEKKPTLTVLNYVTGWTHDAVGYHPAMFLLLENVSGEDLSNQLIRFQARFMDLHTAEVTIGRADVRRELKPHQQFGVALEGANGFELPFELHQWPSIEAKVMCRIGKSGENTETLTIAKVESVARTANEAFESLNQATSFAPLVRHDSAPHHQTHRPHHQPRASHHPRPEPAPKPLVATPQTFAQQPKSPLAPKPAHKPAAATANALNLFSSKTLPGLGADFYHFEQSFGLPQSFDAQRTQWTWAQYKHSGSGAEIVAGAKNHGGKVDLIVVKFPPHSKVDETAALSAAKQMAGTFKTQPANSPVRSVRYLASGRLEMLSSHAQDYKIIGMRPGGEQGNSSFILIISRKQPDPEVLLPQLVSKTALLDCLRFLEPARTEANAN